MIKIDQIMFLWNRSFICIRKLCMEVDNNFCSHNKCQAQFSGFGIVFWSLWNITLIKFIPLQLISDRTDAHLTQLPGMFVHEILKTNIIIKVKLWINLLCYVVNVLWSELCCVVWWIVLLCYIIVLCCVVNCVMLYCFLPIHRRLVKSSDNGGSHRHVKEPLNCVVMCSELRYFVLFLTYTPSSCYIQW